MENNINHPVLFVSKSDCCGCSACYSICPKGAISMVKDKEGFLYPEIDSNLCINCKMCSKVCPIKEVDDEHI